MPAHTHSAKDVECVRRYAAVVLILVLAAIPFAAAVVPGGQGTGPVRTGTDYNKTGMNLTNATTLTPYHPTAVPVRVEVTVSETLIPGPKGEMQAGPRAIGFAADPVTLILVIAGILVVAAGIWYLAKRKPVQEEERDTGNGP